ncbi:MAG: cation:proton antiporter [SAR324 cluster bacterium]|nr:cation:proton antiporter [SAR324 cluster bacterium]
MSAIVHTGILSGSETVSPTLVLGFILLSAYCSGYLLEKLGLPRITGYIFAGLISGPYLLKFYGNETLDDLSFLNSLALAFIAFCAGGELKIASIQEKLKPILFLISGVTLSVFFGVSATVFSLSGFIPFMTQYDAATRIVIAALFGVIAVARSPSSAIAIISETKAKGVYTNTVLTVTIVMDVVVIILFGIVISFGQMMISVGGSIDPAFFLELVFEILIAFVIGFLLGKSMIFLIDKVKVEFPIVIITVGFLVIKFSHLLGDYLKETHNIGLNLEPLLMCMAAGFTIQNFSKHGNSFLQKMDRVSFPIYIAFFAITGASINVDILKSSWMLGLVLVLSRIVMIFIGSFGSGLLSGDAPRIYKNTWLGFITQAGVSLGLLTEIVRRFPEIGVPIQSILIASITLNQVIGPIAFKFALNKVGETHVKNDKERGTNKS